MSKVGTSLATSSCEWVGGVRCANKGKEYVMVTLQGTLVVCMSVNPRRGSVGCCASGWVAMN